MVQQLLDNGRDHLGFGIIMNDLFGEHRITLEAGRANRYL